MFRARLLRLSAVILAFSLIAVGCDPTPPEQEGRQRGGTLTVARTGDIDSLDPHLATAFQSYQALGIIYDTLTLLDPELNVQPGLASEWTYENGGTTLRVTLRDGATFHNGEPVTSNDVKATFERILNEKTGAVALSNFLAIESIETPDETTVVFQLKRPDATLPAAFADVNASIVSAADVQAGTIGKEPNGSGPFEFENWKQGQSLRLTAFEDYWGEGPLIDDVVIRVVPDEQSILAGMRAREYDMGVLTDPSVVRQVSGDDIKSAEVPSISYHVLMLNGSRPPLNDQKVRQAISCAIDRDQLIQASAFGQAEATGPITIPAYDVDPYSGLPCSPPDIDAAEQLLEEAGEADGFTLDTIVIQGEYETAVNEGQNLQSQLSQIGIELDLQTLETNVYVDRWLAADFDAAVALNGGRPDPYIMYARYFTSDGNLNNVAAYRSDELDGLFEELQTETDQDRRDELTRQLQETLLEASPWAWAFTGFESYAMQENVEGFTPMPNGSLQYLTRVSVGG